MFRFPVDDNSTMKSVVEYFQEMYGFTIQHTHLPCLQVGNQKKANYLPMEVGKDVKTPISMLIDSFHLIRASYLHAFDFSGLQNC